MCSGDQKTSISCVDDGVSQSNTRICIGYGGSDISQLLYYLILSNTKVLKLSQTINNCEWIHEAKEKKCHLVVEKAAIHSHTIVMDDKKLTMHLGDEVLGNFIMRNQSGIIHFLLFAVAPLGFFHTDLLEVTGERMLHC